MIIEKDLVKLNLNASSKEDAIRQLANIAKRLGKINNEDKYVEAVLKREDEYSTAVGFSVAIPHGKSDAVNKPFFMYATVDNLDWKAMDGEPVDKVFLIGVPSADAGSTHLKILASLSRKLMKSDFRTKLNAQSSPDDIITLLKESELGI